MQKKNMIRTAALTVTMLGAPLAFSPQQGVTVNQACAQTVRNPDPAVGTCCFQATAYCITPNGNIFNYYYKASGGC
jgi:hypothetical protein